MPSFDIVSELDKHEVRNAIDQANRELGNRFDFRGTGCTFELEEYVVTLKAQGDFQLKQMLEILKPRLVARGIDIRCMDIADPEVNLAAARQKVTLKQGIEQKVAKGIIKPHESVTVVSTGSGLKDVKNAMLAAGEPFKCDPDIKALEASGRIR